MKLRLELFVADVARSRAFYSDVLGFSVSDNSSNAYVRMNQGETVLSLNRYDDLPADHPIRGVGDARRGLGIEIVLEVDDLHARYECMLADGTPLASTLGRRPWGLEDFRLIDPDGYYLRLTERRPAQEVSQS